jgi:hypothetical protein
MKARMARYEFIVPQQKIILLKIDEMQHAVVGILRQSTRLLLDSLVLSGDTTFGRQQRIARSKLILIRFHAQALVIHGQAAATAGRDRQLG